jgi:F420-dependent oxidoreductase-like protein
MTAPTMPGIGIVLHPGPGSNQVDDLVARARQAAAAGVRTVWVPQLYGLDALTALAVIGREVPGIVLGAGVVPVQPRHPLVMAGHARTVQAATHGRLVLGLGVSHPGQIEAYGVPFEHPFARLREHLAVLRPTLRGEPVTFTGEYAGAATEGVSLDVPGADPTVPVVLGAMGPRMLRLAGEEADGTMTFLTGPRTLGEHVVPRIREAAGAAGRPEPRIVAGLPVAVSNDPDRVRGEVSDIVGPYADLPSYRAVLDREGTRRPGDLTIVGSEDDVADQLRTLADLGVTDVALTVVGTAAEQERTSAFLGLLPARPFA